MTTLAEAQDVAINFYVLVPFTTAAAALWAAGEIERNFDCHVVSVSDVNQSALLVEDVTA